MTPETGRRCSTQRRPAVPEASHPEGNTHTMTTDPQTPVSPSNRRALVHNAITDALSKAGDWVPLSVRIAATRAALAEVDAWHADEPASAGLGVSATPSHTDLRQRIAAAVRRQAETGNVRYEALADAVLAVLPPPADRAAVLREADWIEEHCPDHGCVEPETDGCHCEIAERLRRQADEAPLSPYYEHPECGFHWHGRDGMDIPMQDGQPVCPRCELAKVQKKLDYTQRRRDEVGAECKRRGKIKLEQAERIARLERQLDEVQAQLGAEILRAGQAEATLERIQRVIRRLANHAVGFQDMLDDSDRDPWAKTVGADIAGLRRLADEAQQQPTDRDVVEAHDVALSFTLKADEAQQQEPPVHGESVAHLAGDHDDEPTADARQDEAQQDTDSPRTVCVCGHTRGEHLTVSGRLLCDTCDPDSTDNLVCRGFDAL